MNNENAIITNDNQPTDLVVRDNGEHLAFVNPADMPDLDRAETGMMLEKKYYEFKDAGQTVRAIYNGMQTITSKKNDEEKQVPAIVFQNKEGVFLNSGASLVDQFASIPPGTPVEIKFTGKEKTKSGNYVNKFEVRLLNVNVKTATIATIPTPALDRLIAKQDSKVIDAYWEKTYSLKMTNEEGLVHLAEFRNDYKVALDALTGDLAEV